MILKKDEAVSPVIGVMLMIVVTVIIAAAVSAFAGGMADEDKKAPTAVISCQATDKGLLFTVESADYFELIDCNLVLTNGESSRRFTGAEPDGTASTVLEKVNGSAILIDFEMNTGNQFYLEADNDGSAIAGGYLGWEDPDFYLTTDEIGKYRLVDRMSGQTIAEGVINI